VEAVLQEDGNGGDDEDHSELLLIGKTFHLFLLPLK
jgi:hypothetical protein